jgi:small subunit ribosomal protein S8
VLTDPIADMLTRIRNAGHARRVRVSLPESRIRREIARVLKESGYVRDYSTDGDPKKPTLTVELRYHGQDTPMIESIQRVSRPGRRVYVGCEEIPKIRSGLGIAILSTNRGVMTDQQAREARVGGEILARVW